MARGKTNRTPSTVGSAPAPKKSKRDNSLQVIPPDADNPVALEVLACIDSFFNRNRSKLKARLTTWVHKKSVQGVRIIQNGRFEIFLKADGKESTAFDTLLREMQNEEDFNHALKEKTVEQIHSIIIDYAEAQARRDGRIGNIYEFDNYSFLVNYDKCDAQFPHIDLLYPNFQCGLCLTDKSPATITYIPHHPIRTVTQLKKFAWTNMPKSLMNAMKDNPACTSLLEQFGATLADTEEVKAKNLMSRGSVLTLPGSVIHAGPKVSGYRCILFFSGWRRGSKIASYNPDIQYFQSMLCTDIYDILHQSLTVDDRIYVLNRLAEMLPQYKNLYRHYPDGLLRNFTRALAFAQYPKGGREVLIREFAEGRGVVPKGATVGGDTGDRNPRKLVSVSNLQANYEGTYYDVKIYRVLNEPERVMLYYPFDDMWEGDQENEYYKLIWQGRAASSKLFDGKNGTLVDNDGEEIKCCIRS